MRICTLMLTHNLSGLGGILRVEAAQLVALLEGAHRVCREVSPRAKNRM